LFFVSPGYLSSSSLVALLWSWQLLFALLWSCQLLFAVLWPWQLLFAFAVVLVFGLLWSWMGNLIEILVFPAQTCKSGPLRTAQRHDV